MTLSLAHLDDHLMALAARFLWDADHSFRGESTLYYHLARGVATDPELLALAGAIPADQPAPVALFGAVHYLLLRGTGHPVAKFFPSLGGSGAPDEAFPEFRAFCLENAAALRSALAAKRVQTNEVRRCSLLLPAFEIVRCREPHQPLHLIEVGSSAGLNLLWDRYAYNYGSAGKAGVPDSPVVLRCEVRGAQGMPIPASMPEVASRIGIDLNPGDVRDDEQMLWQRALIWPDQPERAELFARAVAAARRDPPRLVQGDALAALPDVLGAIAKGGPVVVCHSHTLNQFTAQARTALDDLLVERGADRHLYRVSLEWYSGDEFSALRLITYHDGGRGEELLARCHQHGKWIEWLLANHE